jgi:hypothetical protein
MAVLDADISRLAAVVLIAALTAETPLSVSAAAFFATKR